MPISLGTFACTCLEARFGGDIECAVAEALRDYAGRIETGSPLLPVPRFWQRGTAEEDRVELEISIPSRPRRILETEARRQGVTFEQMVTHAIFLATADSQVSQRPTLPQRFSAACRHQPPRSQQATEEMVGAHWRQRR